MWRPLVARRAYTLESVGMTPQNKLQRTYQTGGMRQRHVQDVGELDIVNNTVIALQNKQHAGSAKRRDIFITCVEPKK